MGNSEPVDRRDDDDEAWRLLGEAFGGVSFAVIEGQVRAQREVLRARVRAAKEIEAAWLEMRSRRAAGGGGGW